MFQRSANSNDILPRRNSTFRVRDRMVSRIISRQGRPNIFPKNIPNRNEKFWLDFGNTLVATQWRWILAALFAANFLSFLVFGLAWKLATKFNPECVQNVESFSGFFLLAVETIMTIGYGLRYPTEECSQGWFLHICQAMVNVVMQGVFVSAVYVKISKPRGFSSHMFSRKAVVCLRDGELCLIVRLFDISGKISVGTNISMFFVDKSDSHNLQLQELEIEHYGNPTVYPLDVTHRITSTSPLWTYSPQEMLTKKFEILVVAEGCSLVTGQLSQNRTSYINSDILWGHRFKPCVEFDYDKLKYTVHCKQVNKSAPFDTPLCSARELNSIRRDVSRL